MKLLRMNEAFHIELNGNTGENASKPLVNGF